MIQQYVQRKKYDKNLSYISNTEKQSAENTWFMESLKIK